MAALHTGYHIFKFYKSTTTKSPVIFSRPPPFSIALCRSYVKYNSSFRLWDHRMLCEMWTFHLRRPRLRTTTEIFDKADERFRLCNFVLNAYDNVRFSSIFISLGHLLPADDRGLGIDISLVIWCIIDSCQNRQLSNLHKYNGLQYKIITCRLWYAM